MIRQYFPNMHFGPIRQWRSNGFLNSGGAAWSDTGRRSMVGKFAKRAGLKNRSLHRLRKTVICRLAKSGLNLGRIWIKAGAQIQAITGQSAVVGAHDYRDAYRETLPSRNIDALQIGATP